MKLVDKLTLALKEIRWRWAIPYLLLTALGVMGVYFFGAAALSVYQEKSLPCELKAMAGLSETLNDQTVQEIQALPDVLAATGVYELPVTLRVGDYSAGLTVAGIGAGYLETELQQGVMFPESSSMPWLMLSKTSTKSFRDQNDKSGNLTFLNTQLSLTLGDDTVVAGVCGIYQDAPSLAAAYMEQSLAKKLLQQQGQGKAYDYVLARCTNMGVAEQVAKQISGLGLTVEATNTAQQENWASLEKEMIYTLLLGLAFLFCAGMEKAAANARSGPVRQRQREALRWTGMSRREIRRLEQFQNEIVILLGAMGGLLAASALPHLLPDGVAESGTTPFCLSLPLPAGILVALLCGGVELLPQLRDPDFLSQPGAD